MKKTVLFFCIAAALVFAAGCSEKDTDTTTHSEGMSDAQYMEYLEGGTWLHMERADYGFSIEFGRKSSNSIEMGIRSDEAYGVMADGTYTVSDGVITANYSSVGTYRAYVDWSESEFRGFQSNTPCTRKYTIVSCTEPYLTLKTSSGESFRFERKNY